MRQNGACVEPLHAISTIDSHHNPLIIDSCAADSCGPQLW